MKALISGLVIFVSVLISMPVYCADDLLKEMDTLLESMDAEEQGKTETISDKPSPAPSTGIGQLSDHLEMDLTLKTSHYLTSMEQKDDNEAEVNLNFRTWAGLGPSSFHIEGWAEYGTQKNTYAGVSPLFKDDSRERRILEISQLYWMMDDQNLGFTLGKKIVPSNTNSIVPLSQVYHPLDLNVPADPRTFGVWQASLDAALGKNTQFTARVFPYFQDHKIPSQDSRWMPDTMDQTYWYPNALIAPDMDWITAFILYYFGDIIQASPFLSSLFNFNSLAAAGKTLVIENDRPESNLEESGYSGLIKTEVGDLDLFASIFRGPNPFPMIYIEDRGSVVAIIKKNPIVYRMATGGSITWRQYEFHTELLYNYAKDRSDDDYLAYTGGVTITDEWTARLMHIDQVHWRIDYAGESVTNPQNAPGYYFSSRVIRPFTNDMLMHLLLQLNSDINLYYKMDINFNRDAQFHRFGGSYRLYPGVVIEAFADFFDGDHASFYGQWKNNDRINCLLRWSF